MVAISKNSQHSCSLARFGNNSFDVTRKGHFIVPRYFLDSPACFNLFSTDLNKKGTKLQAETYHYGKGGSEIFKLRLLHSGS